MKIAPLGDSALTVSFTDEQADAPAGLLRTVWMSREAIEAARISSVTEVTSSYASVTVFFDPRLLLDAGLVPEEINRWMSDQIQTAASAIRKSRTRKLSHGHMVEMFVCFDTEFGPDLAESAEKCRLPVDEFVRCFCAADYEVACVGFTPGFPYLAGLPRELALPRRASPRTAVPPGSVGIGGNHAGIYPLASPGGWNILGRTPVRLFDPKKNPPALLVAGDRVRFKQIHREEFDSLANQLPEEA